MESQQPQPGLVELMDFLEERGVKRALCTRNFEYTSPTPPHQHALALEVALVIV